MRFSGKQLVAVWMVISSVTIQLLHAQVYNPHEAFAPLFYPSYGDEVRAADGTPGPAYWQNRADYTISASLEDSSHTITGEVTIRYTNNSSQSLPFVWLQLDQELYRPGSKGMATETLSHASMFGRKDSSGGYTIGGVYCLVKGKQIPVEYHIYDTRMQVKLPAAIRAKGGKMLLHINYHFVVPVFGTNRMGRMQTKAGWIYEIAQWYPRMCVYDNVTGWNTLPYLGQGEFYLEYGDFSYAVTVPDGYIVTGSGGLQNTAEALTRLQRQRLALAATSDTTVMVRTMEEATAARVVTAPLHKRTWRFQCRNARDVAFAASPGFVWDAARIQLPGGKQSLAMSVYPADSATAGAWKKATQMVKAAVEYYSAYLCPYPYPVAANVAGIAAGMEYPGIVFCSAGASGSDLWDVISHEFGHNWFPMITGSNERRFGWMDEGLNTFINGMAGMYARKGISSKKIPLQQLMANMFTDSTESILSLPDVQPTYRLGMMTYYKPALGLRLLRENILGEQRFDSAFRYYMQQWAYKHPQPYDFFHCIENYSGETLDWFWRGWFMNAWEVDLAVTDVKYTPGIGSVISLACLQKMPMPVTLAITDTAGKTTEVSLPVEIWQRSGAYRYLHKQGVPLKKVVIDPGGSLPEKALHNNTWMCGEGNPSPKPAG